MTKQINDVCVIVQARLGSQRVPQKMIKPFCDTTLLDILFSKLLKSSIVPRQNIYVSACEKEITDIAEKYNLSIFERSHESAQEEHDIRKIFEWHDKLPFKYVVLISACNPLLTIDTIDAFVVGFLRSDNEGAFSVIEKKTYYWDKDGNPITDWGGRPSMNTKFVEPVYEAAHCLYASRLDIIKDGFWMDSKSPPNPYLCLVDELETFDIDYPWQFDVAEVLYEKIR